MAITIGSKVRIRSDNNEGIVIGIKDNFAQVLTDKANWYPLEVLEDISDHLIDRFIRNDLENSIDFILAVDAFRLLSEYKFNPYVLASSTKISIFPHQIDEVLKIIDNPKIMLADEVGLGKTIVAALVANELNARGLADKMLFVVPKSLLRKWEEELKDRFEIDAKIISSEEVKVNGNPFKEKAFAYIASMDYLKQDNVKDMINNDIDLVVVDEAHKFATKTERLELGKYLASKAKFLLLLTATPHNGDKDDFLDRIKLLDPYIVDPEGSSYLVIRNMKEDVIDLDGREVFPPRESKTIKIPLSREEKEISEMLDKYIAELLDNVTDNKERGAVRFLASILRKRASSSPSALKKTLERRLAKLGEVDKERIIDSMNELESIEEFDEDAYEEYEGKVIGYTPKRVSKRSEEDIINNILKALNNLKSDSKLQTLLDWIKKIKEGDKGAKIVIFTEYRDTLEYLKKELSKYYSIQSIDGSMSIDERVNTLKSFKSKDEIMICTDAAGEGIDMQFSNVEVNYDLPWNPTRLEQRMGRIHRIGQKRKAFYYNFLIDPENSIDGYILAKLLEKIESIKLVLKDKVYDIIGSLVNEEDIIKLYEELLRVPREEWEARIKALEKSIDEKRKILEGINRLLSANKLDRTKLEDMRRIIKDTIDSDEVKRFVDLFINNKGGKMERFIRSTYLERWLIDIKVLRKGVS